MKEWIGDRPRPEDIHAVHTGQVEGRLTGSAGDIQAKAEAATPLTDEELKINRSCHEPDNCIPRHCKECCEDWPCLDTQYLATIDALLAQLKVSGETLAEVMQWERLHRGRLNYLDDLRDILQGGE